MTADPHSSGSDSIIVPQEFFDAVVESEREFCETIRKVDPRTVVADFVAGQGDLHTMLAPFLGRFTSPKILEIGSGNGFGLCALLKRGFDVVAVEPGDEYSFEGRWHRAAHLLRSNGIASPETVLHRVGGENLPFPDNTFDIAISVAVLEHVHDPEQCVREAVRVLKPGGLLILNVPNYDAFWEGHYNSIWLPYVLTNKRAAKWYVRNLLRRPDRYVDEMNFMSPATFGTMARALPDARMNGIHPFCIWPFNAFSAAVYYLQIGYVTRHRALALLERLRLSQLFVFFGRPVVRLLTILGLSPTFNVLFTKQPAAALSDRARSNW